jgi:hypothetical protein
MVSSSPSPRGGASSVNDAGECGECSEYADEGGL